VRFSYRLIEENDGFIAECVESDAAGEGRTVLKAIESLRMSLEERMLRPDAVAPPSRPTNEKIELVAADAAPERPSLDLGGPGDVA